MGKFGDILSIKSATDPYGGRKPEVKKLTGPRISEFMPVRVRVVLITPDKFGADREDALIRRLPQYHLPELPRLNTQRVPGLTGQAGQAQVSADLKT